ncbi:OX-2 membrane glycoprotein [Chanos chanos]|uniref:OX-2 membrane glycoprotein n=1 Tax=Chanos chanos TaxID=29144 RepID=A0A6J2VWD9_CHACN|nr:OX-2 membrane glycoprotein-like [Chanos chanos]
MGEYVVSRCLQLWICLTAVLRLQGKVSAPADLQVMVGLPLTLGCNVTMAAGDKLMQVLWTDPQNKTILSYSPEKADSVSTQKEHVELATHHEYTSAITIKKTESGDEGCYRCVFNIYPVGTQEGKACLSLMAKVDLVGNKTAVSGKLATLSCRYRLAEKVKQVLWKKTAEQGDTTVVASFFGNSLDVMEPFRDRFKLSRSLGNTQLSIQSVKTEDEGCYTCEFNTYPEGTKSGTACLTVYVLPKPQVDYVTVSPGVIEANCSVVSRPASEITWNIENDNRTLGPAVTSSYQQGDGTTMTVSSLLLQAELLDEETVTCVVQHKGLESPLSVSISKLGKTHVILIAVGCVTLLLLLCLCVCLKMC